MTLSNLQWHILPGISAHINQSVSQSQGKRIVKVFTSKSSRSFSSFNSVPATGNLHGEIYYYLRMINSTITRDGISKIFSYLPKCVVLTPCLEVMSSQHSISDA